jgi:hypothetical protein
MSTLTRFCRSVVFIALAVVVTACVSHPPKVDCEGELRPINPPAPVTSAESGPHED